MPATLGQSDLPHLLNAGLQVFDISDVRRPKNVGYFIPDDPSARRGPLPRELVLQMEDVIVDRRGYIYVSEKNSGIRILTLDQELARRAL